MTDEERRWQIYFYSGYLALFAGFKGEDLWREQMRMQRRLLAGEDVDVDDLFARGDEAELRAHLLERFSEDEVAHFLELRAQIYGA
jgi:hypothetical protein